MGVEDTASRGIFQKTILKHKGTVFSIDTRGEVLSSQLEASIIIPHTAKTRVNINDIICDYIYFDILKHTLIKIIIIILQYHYEALFRSEQYAIVDNACREYLFLIDFFKARNTQALEIFNQVRLN